MRRGFTLAELMVYMFIALLAALTVHTLFNVGNSASRATTSAYLVSGNTETAIRWLRRDLRETALSSIRVHPDAHGISFAAARTVEDQELVISKFGTPEWSKTVFYTLETEPGDKTASLVRWERPWPAAERDFLPHASSLMPSPIPSEAAKRKVVLHNLAAPNTDIPGVGNSGPSGGFDIQFLRRLGGEDGAEQLTPDNPSQGNPHDNTKLVDVTLKLVLGSGSHTSYYGVHLRVAPQY
ncbi:MAG: prepilin-type N-terminal cleavage/methylation domain-containing protein [Candidatus Eremiobacteraeota bacterium]|nr:prepilin-type N-terminal cleavage/methylation domain-containing protein [Candidatus Eremiobacteraeota bacterium]